MEDGTEKLLRVDVPGVKPGAYEINWLGAAVTLAWSLTPKTDGSNPDGILLLKLRDDLLEFSRHHAFVVFAMMSAVAYCAAGKREDFIKFVTQDENIRDLFLLNLKSKDQS